MVSDSSMDYLNPDYEFPGMNSIITPVNLLANSMYTSVLDELLSILNADAAAMIRYNHPKNEFVVEMGRGKWQRLIGRSFPAHADLLSFFTLPGDTNLDFDKDIFPIQLLDDFQKDIKSIFHIPLIFAGNHLGVLWIGHPNPIDAASLVLINSISDVIASSLYSTRYEHQISTDGSETVHSLVKKLSQWDSNTFNHSLRMIPWAKATAAGLGCTDQEIQTVCWATLLHDVGKLSVPKSILYKPGPLSKDEWTLVRLHPTIGARMVASVRKLIDTREIIGSHHEKFDGSGYPYGLSHENIPLGGRILAVVDAYGAMTEERVYKRTFSHEEAIREIEACSGSHFDPEVSQAFMKQFLDR